MCKGAAGIGSPAGVRAAPGRGKAHQETQQAGPASPGLPFGQEAWEAKPRTPHWALPVPEEEWQPHADLEGAHCVDLEQHSDGDAGVARLLLAGSSWRWLLLWSSMLSVPGASTVYRSQEATRRVGRSPGKHGPTRAALL